MRRIILQYAFMERASALNPEGRIPKAEGGPNSGIRRVKPTRFNSGFGVRVSFGLRDSALVETFPTVLIKVTVFQEMFIRDRGKATRKPDATVPSQGDIRG